MNFELEIGFPLGLGGKQIFRVILFVPLLTSFLHLSGREREEKGEGGRINGVFFLFSLSLSLQRDLKALSSISWMENAQFRANCTGGCLLFSFL